MKNATKRSWKGTPEERGEDRQKKRYSKTENQEGEKGRRENILRSAMVGMVRSEGGNREWGSKR